MARINGLTGLVITRLDALDKFDTIKICTGLPGQRYAPAPLSPRTSRMLEMRRAPVRGVPRLADRHLGCARWEDLPEQARNYLDRLCELLGVPLDLVSVGPHRDQTIILATPSRPYPAQVGQLVQSLTRDSS